jgi:amicyanin
MIRMKRDGYEGYEDPLKILDERLASGEIRREEYEALRQTLMRDRSSGPRRHRSALSTSGLTILIVLGVVLAFAFTSMALTYGPWRTSEDGAWNWGDCCSFGGMGGRMDGYGDVDVAIVNHAFSPEEIRVPAGTTVTWVNMDHVMHTVTFGGHDDDHDGGDVIDSGPMYHMDAFSYTFTEPGVYEYHCDPHPYMTGTVIVEG